MYRDRVRPCSEWGEADPGRRRRRAQDSLWSYEQGGAKFMLKRAPIRFRNHLALANCLR